MSKSRKQTYEERVRQDESEAHQNRRVINRQLDEIRDVNLLEIDDEWDFFEDFTTFEKIKRSTPRNQ